MGRPGPAHAQDTVMQLENHIYDAVIVGAGPAGVSCAVWLARLGFAPLLLEAGGQVGGLCRQHAFRDDWNASLPGRTGPQVADNLALSLEQAGVPLRLSRAVEAVAPDGHGFTVATQGGETALGRHLVIATGVRARGLPGAKHGGLLVGPGQHIVSQRFQGKRVAVLGGGDNAFENALYAIEHGARAVQVFARTVRAQHQFVRRVPAGCVTRGDYAVDAAARTVNGQAYDVIMVFYGWEPCVDFAAGLQLARSGRGYVATDWRTAQASHEGVYAIGEVAQRQHPCVVTALADGVTAAKAIQARIEAGR